MPELTSLHAQMPALDRVSKNQTQHAASAVEFEALVLAEMLRAAGAGQPTTGIEGGVGEDQFASFLLDAQARAIAARGGIGLAEMVMRANIESGDGTRE
ncbi:rod-binding protein [Roseinatronobacter sp. NSM]|uniref:rod-binding protein n=1 Tax=Roseinatronobacter sp. NSM TaxID=3457785 RepID=UPI004036FA76